MHSQMPKFLFVGERHSQKALQMGVKWEDGRLAAKQLFDALLANGIEPKGQKYMNWFRNGQGRLVARPGIAHVKIVHPAARGKIRDKAVYAAHVRKKLTNATSGL